MFQLFSKEKEYIYKPEDLKFEKDKNSGRRKVLRSVLIGIGIHAIAFIFIFGYCSYFEPPGNTIRKKHIDYYSEQFDIALAKINELERFFADNTVVSDKVYREVLNLDSLPSSVREAGIGGSATQAPYDATIEHIGNTIASVNQFFARLRVQKNSYDTILKEAVKFDERLDYIPGIPPVVPNYSTYISSYFGTRTDPFTHIFRRHKGLDFVGPENCEIFATGSGTVTLAKYSRRGYGNEVVINHGYGYTTKYAHLNKILVEEGQKVTRGQLIGLMGSTGRSTGTHLHYEVRLNNRAVNPIYYYEDDLSTEEYELITKR